MSSLFELVTERQGQERQARLIDYFRFLSTVDINKPSPADAAKLAEYLPALRKSATDAEADWKRVRQAKNYLAAIAETEGADPRGGEDAYFAACAERQEGIRKLNENVTAALAAMDNAAAAYERRKGALLYLQQLSETNAPLHAAVTTAAPAEQQRKRSR